MNQKNNYAQDLNFSQFELNKSYYNPAFTASEKGMFRSNLIYRKLWPNFPSNFSTKYFNLNYKTYNAYGMGIYAINNIAGESFLRTNTFGASYSWRGEINNIAKSYFQLGIRANYSTQRIDYSQLTFSDELDEIYGNIYSSTFKSDIEAINYFDFSIGALIQFPIIRANRRVLINTLGIAVHHFTRPIVSFRGKENKLPIKLTIHGQTEYKTSVYSLNKENRLKLRPSFVYELQGNELFSNSSSNNLLVGIDLETDPIFGGIWFSSQVINNSNRTYKNLIYIAGFKFNSDNSKTLYRIHYSYDMATSNYSKNTKGAHELGLSIDFLFKPKYKYNIFSF